MRRFATPLSALVATLALAAGNASAGQMLVNGSFEANAVGNGSWITTNSLTGWSTGQLGAEVRNNVAGAAFNGKNFIELDSTGNSWIEQVVHTSANQVLHLSFAYSPREFVSAGSNGIEVLWNGVSKGTFTGNGGVMGNSWKLYTMDLTATGSLSTLRFRAVGVNDSVGGSLDDVQLNVPEPATPAILALGLGMLALFQRRRKA